MAGLNEACGHEIRTPRLEIDYCGAGTDRRLSTGWNPSYPYNWYSRPIVLISFPGRSCSIVTSIIMLSALIHLLFCFQAFLIAICNRHLRARAVDDRSLRAPVQVLTHRTSFCSATRHLTCAKGPKPGIGCLVEG